MRRTFLVAILALLAACGSGAVTVAPLPRDDAFINDVQQRTFRWFWDLTNPQNGLTPDRAPRKSFSSVAAVGFALTA